MSNITHQSNQRVAGKVRAAPKQPKLGSVFGLQGDPSFPLLLLLRPPSSAARAAAAAMEGEVKGESGKQMEAP
jgi:hypothetical protein